MAWAPDYVKSEELKSSATITVSADDAEVAFAISAASRAIDDHTGRQFGVLTTAAARYYQAHWDPDRRRHVVAIDDLMTTTDLVVKTNDADSDTTFGNTLVLDTDFRLAPYNAAADSRPWLTLIDIPGTTHGLPTRQRSIEVTALWGWTAVPSVVKSACLLQATRLFSRKSAPFGVAGSPEIGSEMRLLARLDPDVQLLLSTVRRYFGVG